MDMDNENMMINDEIKVVNEPLTYRDYNTQ